MIRAVFDASTVISGAGWGAESYHCLVAVAQRQARSFATQGIINEWQETLKELDLKAAKFRRNPWPTPEWLMDVSYLVMPSALVPPAEFACLPNGEMLFERRDSSQKGPKTLGRPVDHCRGQTTRQNP